MNIIEYSDREMLFMQVADAMATALKKCLLMHDFASFAVPGGTTPGPVFDMLSGIDLEWIKVHVLLTDERWVSESDPRSNARLVRERLITDRAAQAQFIPYYREGQGVEEGCATVSEVLNDELPISLLLLGMGADMHTASLFPGADGLAAALDSHAPALCPIRDPAQDITRASLSAPVLKGAMETHLIITGTEKRAALKRAQHLSVTEAPIATVLGDCTVHWAA